jgi:diphthamide synthase (EF-2-diphthine--ammonia ligase)
MTEWGNYERVEYENKKGVVARLKAARKDGVRIGDIEAASKKISIHTVCDVLEAKKLPYEIWEEMDRVLKEFGY